MLLYEHPLSSHAQEVKIALREKGVPFELELPESFGTGRAKRRFLEDWLEARLGQSDWFGGTDFSWADAAASRMAGAATLYTTGARRREYRDHRLEWMIKSGGIDVVLSGLRDDNIRFSWPSTS